MWINAKIPQTVFVLLKVMKLQEASCFKYTKAIWFVASLESKEDKSDPTFLWFPQRGLWIFMETRMIILPMPVWLRHHWERKLNDLFFFNWSTVDLQCCTNLCCIEKWLSYTHIHILFPLWFILGDWMEFQVLYSNTLLFIHSKFNGLHLPSPNCQYIPPPHPALATTSLISVSVSLFLFCRLVHLCPLLDFQFHI